MKCFMEMQIHKPVLFVDKRNKECEAFPLTGVAVLKSKPELALLSGHRVLRAAPKQHLHRDDAHHSVAQGFRTLDIKGFRREEVEEVTRPCPHVVHRKQVGGVDEARVVGVEGDWNIAETV